MSLNEEPTSPGLAPPPPPFMVVEEVDPRLLQAVWLVWVEGGDPIGPVSAQQLARGLRAGKVPSEARVRLVSDVFWSEVLDVVDIVAALKTVTAASEPPPASAVPDPRFGAPKYLVWINGGDPVGPVSADQIARGIRAGKVPPDASLQHVDDLFARDVLDEPEVIAALKRL